MSSEDNSSIEKRILMKSDIDENVVLFERSYIDEVNGTCNKLHNEVDKLIEALEYLMTIVDSMNGIIYPTEMLLLLESNLSSSLSKSVELLEIQNDGVIRANILGTVDSEEEEDFMSNHSNYSKMKKNIKFNNNGMYR